MIPRIFISISVASRYYLIKDSATNGTRMYKGILFGLVAGQFRLFVSIRGLLRPPLSPAAPDFRD